MQTPRRRRRCSPWTSSLTCPRGATDQVYASRAEQAEIRMAGTATTGRQLTCQVALLKLRPLHSLGLSAAVNTTEPQVCTWKEMHMTFINKQDQVLRRTIVEASAPCGGKSAGPQMKFRSAEFPPLGSQILRHDPFIISISQHLTAPSEGMPCQLYLD